MNIVDAYRNMMDARTAFFEEPRNRRIRRSRFQQFDARFANRKHCEAHFLLCYLFSFNRVQTKRFFPESSSFLDAASCDAYVIDLHDVYGQGLSLPCQLTRAGTSP